MTDPPRYQFVLYVAGDSELSQAAQRNFAEIARRWLPEHSLTCIDIVAQVGLAREHRVAATPMLVRTSPAPVRKILGDLSDLRRVAEAIGVSTFDE